MRLVTFLLSIYPLLSDIAPILLWETRLCWSHPLGFSQADNPDPTDIFQSLSLIAGSGRVM